MRTTKWTVFTGGGIVDMRMVADKYLASTCLLKHDSFIMKSAVSLTGVRPEADSQIHKAVEMFTAT